MIKGQEQETPFNFAMIFYVELNKLISRKDEAYIEGNLWGWYRGLQAIKRKISFKIKDKEYFKVRFGEVKNILESPVPSQVAGDMNKLLCDEATLKLEEIDEALTDVMDSNKMIFPSIKVNGGLEEIKKRFNIE